MAGTVSRTVGSSLANRGVALCRHRLRRRQRMAGAV